MVLRLMGIPHNPLIDKQLNHVNFKDHKYAFSHLKLEFEANSLLEYLPYYHYINGIAWILYGYCNFTVIHCPN